MAEKGFGVKEVNLIGASGTPTITSPNNLNLNANNVAISTNVSIGGTLSVTGNVSVGGTLTYEDVTNIDSVGLITARSGVVTPNVDVDDFVTVGSNIQLGNAGVVTATTFSGSAASLTSIPAANITGTLPAISGANLTNLDASDLASGTIPDARFPSTLPAASAANLTDITVTPTNSDIQVAYIVTNNGSSAYRFAGNGVVSSADNPDLYFIRGKKYRFINNSGGSHPFQIREASGGTAYSTGVTNNGAASGNIDFAPTFDSPAQLVYQCTSHGGMVGNIYLRGAAGNENNVGVVTASSFESTTFSKTPTNTPAFHAFRDGSTSPSISDQTITKITLLTTETLDTDNAYDNSSSGTTANRFTVPSGKGGYYQVAAGLNFYADSNDMKHARVMIYKNGSVAMTAYGFVSSYAAGTRHLQCDIAGMLNLNASDYLEVYAYLDINGGSGGYISNDSQGLRGNYFSAFKLII